MTDALTWLFWRTVAGQTSICLGRGSGWYCIVEMLVLVAVFLHVEVEGSINRVIENEKHHNELTVDEATVLLIQTKADIFAANINTQYSLLCPKGDWLLFNDINVHQFTKPFRNKSILPSQHCHQQGFNLLMWNSCFQVFFVLRLCITDLEDCSALHHNKEQFHSSSHLGLWVLGIAVIVIRLGACHCQNCDLLQVWVEYWNLHWFFITSSTYKMLKVASCKKWRLLNFVVALLGAHHTAITRQSFQGVLRQNERLVATMMGFFGAVFDGACDHLFCCNLKEQKQHLLQTPPAAALPLSAIVGASISTSPGKEGLSWLWLSMMVVAAEILWSLSGAITVSVASGATDRLKATEAKNFNGEAIFFKSGTKVVKYLWR